MEDLKLFNKRNIKKVGYTPGVYVFFDSEKTPLYVGKSVSLRDRLSSYFSKNLLSKTRKLIEKTRYFKIIYTNSEIEAILLEANLVKNLKPKYNIELKDDKHPLYIVITNEDYPRVLTARREEALKDQRLYFGPYPNSSSVKATLGFLRRVFPFSQHKKGKNPCIYSQMGMCNPCPNVIENTQDPFLKNKLKKEYLKNIKNIEKVLQGKLDKVKQNLEKEMLSLAKKLNFEEANSLKKKLEKINYVTQRVTPINDFLRNPNLLEDIRKKEIRLLRKNLSPYINNLTQIRRIECYDVSHTQGSLPTASMVVFLDGYPENRLYRHFRIRQGSSKDDLLSLKEVALRREKYLESWGRPDIILVDGGKTQTKVFFEVFRKHKIPTVGIAKKNETIIIPYATKEKISYKVLNITNDSLNLLRRIRDEAHRFARRYHKHLLRKALIPNAYK